MDTTEIKARLDFWQSALTKLRTAKGYSEAGASHTKRTTKGFKASSGSPREDIEWQNYTLRQRGRILYISTPLATSAINTMRTKVVGVGLELKSTIDREALGLSPEAARAWQHKTESEWRLWSGRKQNCDATGMNTFAGQQQLALISWLMSGDVVAAYKRYPVTPLNPYSLRVHLIEADRCSTPTDYCAGAPTPYMTDGVVPEGKPGAGHKIHDGVEIDDNGMVVAYYICNVYPYEFISEKPEWKRVEAYGRQTGLPNIVMVMNSERPDQYRGVSYLAPVIETLLQLRRYTESELMTALIQSFFSAWIYTETDQSKIPFNEVGGGYAPPGAVNADGGPIKDYNPDADEYKMGPGTVNHLGSGEKVQFATPTAPVAGFDVFIKVFSKLVGSSLEIPEEVLMKEFNSSYSASRAALLEMWEGVKMRRHWFVDDFCQPTYEVWLSEAVARGRVKAPGFFDDPMIRVAYCGAQWIGPVQGQLDPLKEANAAILLADHGFKTHTQLTREMGGGDFEANVEQLAAENEMLAAAGGGTKQPVPTGEGKEGNE